MWGWIPNGILAAGPSRVTIRRKATADIGASRSLMKTYRPGSCSRWRRRRARSSMPVNGWTARLLSVSLKTPKSTPMSLAGLRGADHAFYDERARVLLPFRTGARTYLGEDRVPLLMPEPPR